MTKNEFNQAQSELQGASSLKDCRCWWNPETGYLEACPKHEAEAMDRMMEVEERRYRETLAQLETARKALELVHDSTAVLNHLDPEQISVIADALAQIGAGQKSGK